MDATALLLRAHARVTADPPEAEGLCRDVLDADPFNGFALHLLGVLRLKQGAAAEAVAWLRRAAEARPDHIDTRLALAEACFVADDDAASARELTLVLAARPEHAAALAALSAVRLRQGDPVAARDLATRAVAAAPDAIEPLVALGGALAALRRHAEARDILTRAVARDPDHARAQLNLGNVLIDLNEEAAAERHMRRATCLQPDLPEAWASLGFLLAGSDRLTEAIAACDRAIALRPDFPQAHWNRSFAALRAGDFARGWADYEWRHRHPVFGFGAQVLPGEEWDGGDLAGRRLLVNATQGLGDTIQMARYLPLLVARGASVTLCCPVPLLRLLECFPVRLLPRGAEPPAYDCWIDLMSLPRRFATTPDTIPAPGGYLDIGAAPRRPEGRPARGLGVGPRVGLVCAGNPLHSNDFRRSMPAAGMARLGEVPGVTLVSLQAGPAGAALAAALGGASRPLESPDMAATAAIVAGLDLVIAVDTAVAHLAGALGRPVWILIPRAPDWRWLAGRDDTPWYASARLFRQRRAGDWPAVIREVAAALANFTRDFNVMEGVGFEPT